MLMRSNPAAIMDFFFFACPFVLFSEGGIMFCLLLLHPNDPILSGCTVIVLSAF